MRPYKVKWLISKTIYAKKDRNGPPGTKQGLSMLSPDTAMLFAPCRCTHPPPSVTYPFCSHRISRKKHCMKWHHEAESLMMPYGVIGQEKVNLTSVYNYLIAWITLPCTHLYTFLLYILSGQGCDRASEEYHCIKQAPWLQTPLLHIWSLCKSICYTFLYINFSQVNWCDSASEEYYL